MGPKTTETCLTVLNRGESIADLNETNIALILKTTNLRFVSDYRLISMCNVSYKIVTKCLANRLKLILNDIISETQSAFIPRRAITGILLSAMSASML